MNDKGLIKLLIGIIGLAVFILGFTIKLSSKPKKSKRIQVENKARSSFLIQSYYFLNKNILCKKYLQKIRSRIEMLDLSDNWTINKRTMQYTYISLGISTILLAVVILLGQRLYFVIIGILTIYIIHNQIIKLLVDKMDDKLLYQFEKFLGDIRHHYHEHGMIDEAIYDTIEESDYEISLHGDKMYEVLSSEDVEEKLLEYYDLVPNKYFKTFLALCYTLQRFGDQVVDGKSMFLSNLNYLKQEINLEILRRKKLGYLFQSLSMISIVPIFFLSAIETWAKSNLPELRIYYEGSYGFIVQVILFLTVILCFELINKLQSNQEYRQNEHKLEKKLLKNKIIKKWIGEITAKQYSKKTEDLLKLTGTRLSLEGFYLKRILYSMVGVFISIFVIINAHHITKTNILYSSHSLYAENYSIDQKAELELIEIERSYILSYHRKNPSYAQLEESLHKDEKIIHKKMIPTMAKQIVQKLKIYENQYFKWWELLISILIGAVFYYIPYWVCIFRKGIIYMSMEDEVMQFHTIILMLMHIDRISVEDLLEWMGVFAGIFKDSIYNCINDFEYGDLEALEKLKTDEPFMPFVRIVENLQSACDRISIKQAFDELKIERGYYQEKRKQDNEMIVNKKGSWGKIIAFIPLTGTLILYLITPFIHLSITQFINYSNQIKSFL